MCFSVLVEKNLKTISKRFGADISDQAFVRFRNNQKLEASIGPEKLKASLGLKRKPKTSKFQQPDEEGRVFPNTFAPVIVHKNNKREIVPMRYRIRPNGSKHEVPAKYNLFNARMDSLLVRKTWSPLLTKNHCLFPFKKFYEWVPKGDGTKLVAFSPEDKDTMWAPGLFDYWQSEGGQFSFYSFALITTEPPKEVLQAGHDRCPIFLQEDRIDTWLKASSLKLQSAIKLIEKREDCRFVVEDVQV